VVRSETAEANGKVLAAEMERPEKVPTAASNQSSESGIIFPIAP